MQFGWIRLQAFSLGGKHSLWNKRYLILCVGEMYLLKSQSVSYVQLFLHFFLFFIIER